MEFIKKYFKHFCFAFIVLIGLSAVIFNPVSRLDANTDEGRVKFIEKYGWKVEKTPYLCEKVQIPVTFDGALENYAQIQKRSGNLWLTGPEPVSLLTGRIYLMPR